MRRELIRRRMAEDRRAFSIGRGEILEQFDFVSARGLHDGEFDFSPRDTSDFFGHSPSLMRRMRKLEAENILPKIERTIEI